jgi:predicted extracellular nuclease
MKRTLITAGLLAAAAALMLAGCGDDESPTSPGGNPTASTLTLNVSGLEASITASWTQNTDSDFNEYRLYRSTIAGIEDNAGDATVVATLSTAGDTTYTDAGLDWDTEYFYALKTTDTEGLEAWSNEASATTPDSSGVCDYLTCYEIQGQAASSPYEGEEVTVLGIVVVGGDEYYSSSGPVAVISDPEGGPWRGLTLFGDSIASLQRGDSVLVSGEVQEWYGFTEVGYISSVEILGTGASLPDPHSISTVDISTAGDPEQYESVLLKVTDAIVTTEPDQYGVFGADDGSGECNLDDNGDYSYSPSVGDTLNYAVGVGWYAFSEWTLQPRDDSDIDVSSGGGGGGGGGGGDTLTCYEVQGQASGSPYEGETVSVTGIVTVGGGEFYSSSAAYAVIQDAGGSEWSGLVLFGNSVSGLVRGDSVTVTGEVQEYYGLTELSYIDAVEVHSQGHSIPAATQLTTGELAGEEKWEGVLVTVSDVTVTSDPDQYNQFYVDDGSGDYLVDDLGDYTYEATQGDNLQSITGVDWYSYDEFKLQPRDDVDIVQ